MSYRFFQNRECEYFPCHKTAKEDSFNCLFCFCPLYALGRRCGGSFNSSGIIHAVGDPLSKGQRCDMTNDISCTDVCHNILY